MLWSDSPTMGVSDYPSLLYFSCFLVALVQLVAAVFWTSRDVSIFSLRLDISTVGWMPRRCIGRLNSALDVSDMIWTLSKGPKEILQI